ncbi:MAG: universal stress protein [Dehalococcoidia bacterium]
MYRTILFTTDGSDLAEAAIPNALHLATSTGAVVVAVQVIDTVGQIMAQTTPSGWVGGAGRYAVESAEEVVAAERSEADAHLEATRQRLLDGGAVEVRTQILEGHPGSAIVDAARDLGADVIVMATHGRAGLGRALLGSVADHVVRHASCPVLLVRPPEA